MDSHIMHAYRRLELEMYSRDVCISNIITLSLEILIQENRFFPLRGFDIAHQSRHVLGRWMATMLPASTTARACDFA